MRVSAVTFWTFNGIVGYLLGIAITGGMRMTSTGAVKDTAQVGLDDANNKLDVANSHYNTAQNNLAFAQQTIHDATCFTTNYDNFTKQLVTYCNPTFSGNDLSDLIADYGINIVSIPDTTSQSTRSVCDWLPITYSCTKYDGNGKSYLSTCTKLQCFPYTITTTYLSQYGTTIKGGGSNSQMNCGLYNHGIVVRTTQYLKSDTGVITDDKYDEHKTKTYASQENVDAIIDATLTTSTYEVDRTNINYQAIAASLLSLIASQCQFLANNIKQPPYYQNIVTTTQATIPGLQDQVSITQSIYNNATAFKILKQGIFDTANDNYQSELSLWLPLILAVPAAVGALLYCYESAQTDNKDRAMYDLDKGEPLTFCFKPNAAKSLPIAEVIGVEHTQPVDQVNYSQKDRFDRCSSDEKEYKSITAPVLV